MSKPKTWLLAGAALALLAGAGAAAAQPDGDGKAGAQPRRHVHMRHGDPAQHLRDILQLRPDQEPALKAFLEATKAGHDRGGARFERDETKTTLERLNDMEARMARHQAAMKTRIDATRTFYGQLDAKQKKAFDAMPMLMFAGPGFGPVPMPHMALRMPMPPMPPAPPAPPAPPSPPGE
ncbi:Spy/CpxP family protein refolding chaperone [Phenylobacterium sp.]|uniref:Spy/CpxP family protein refolding chaperone n=1 Tax=Phenylobacterium sp. TaxID=1871053 RepID=UPI00391BCF0A